MWDIQTTMGKTSMPYQQLCKELLQLTYFTPTRFILSMMKV